MPNPRYSELSKDKGFPGAGKEASNKGKLTGEVYGQRASKTAFGNVNMKTRQYSDPAGFKTQPKDRTWGMRKADGLAQCKGLGGKNTDY